jgi:L-threonylcarbamoyladenylate synthase
MTDEINNAIQILKAGGVIVYPTDTIWGIGCDATCDEAVEKIYRIKKRYDEKSMLILLDHETKLLTYVAEIPQIAWDLLEVTDKPLTIIYPGGQNLSGSLLGEDGSVGIRIVRDEFCSQLIRKFGKPIVSTSANISGQPWPKSFRHIDKNLLQSVDYVVRWRQEEEFSGKPSGIVKLGLHGEVQVIRE